MAGEIRQPIDVASLERYIDQNVPDISTPIELKQFGYGQSNPTYQIKDRNGKKFVMRKKPPGKLLSKTAHQVDREYKILHALQKTDVPVPKVYCLCQDTSVIETDFYIMEFLDGRIFEDPALPGVTPAERTAMWHDAIRVLAKFHRVVPKEVDLENFGRHSGFYNRQLKTFATLSAAQAETKDVDTGEAVGSIPHYDEMVAFFKDPKTQPKDRSTFVHGDYKIDNVVFHKTEPRVLGVLDWEMATIGHPLSDLANLLTPHLTATHPIALRIGRGNTAFKPGATEGLPSRESLIELYAKEAGWDPNPDITWGDAFGIYRGAIIMQGIAARYATRQASSAKAMDYGSQMRPYGNIAWDLVQQQISKQGGKAKL
ncbi:APH-domain-containing protein [Patellaria atrata CBS 101060]|uniref:APH-domain-containing protein n=1 Tax=Patellaria atrata CBS 101060 TaxID=1346257 RepID=A0A9P4S7G6_9PEZI|nr:APH-domain-containing protein [Patellaria atrata CBS 101060]